MEFVLIMALLMLAEVFLLLFFLHQFQQTRLGYLKYISTALVIGCLTKIILLISALFGLEGMAANGIYGAMEMLYVILLNCAVVNFVGRQVNLFWVTLLASSYSLLAISLLAMTSPIESAWLIVRLPLMLALGHAIWLLLRHDKWVGELGHWGIATAYTLYALNCLFLPIIYGSGEFLSMVLSTAVITILIAISWLLLHLESILEALRKQSKLLEATESEKKRLEYHFSQTQKLESLGALAGGIAHDFNNMLTAILGYASLAVKKLPNDSDVRQDVYMIMSGARQAVELTGQMLTYAGKGSVDFKAVDINQVIEEMDALMRSIVPSGVSLSRQIARDLPRLKGDRVKLGQALMQLVANAVDAVNSDDGEIELSTGLMDVNESLLRQSFFGQQLSPGAYVFLKVRDDGVGIEPVQVGRIFDPFYSEKNSGKGLGLSTLSGIVRQHKGCVLVRSEPGKGAEFVLLFPAIAYEETRGITEAEGLASKTTNILFADDDPRIRNLLSSILEDDRIRLTIVADGREALEQFEERPGEFDLLLIDCTMPKMSGPEFYRHVRSLGSDVPVILISGYHQEQVIRNISSDPRAHFVKKPFNVDDILAEINNALSAEIFTEN